MMKNQVYETLPATYGTYNKIPTLLGQDGNGAGDYLNDHPVGLNAAVSCGGQYNWDCTETNGVISMNGPNSSQFVTNYGFFVSLQAYNNNATVMCTTCHNQHLMNVVKVTNGTNSRSADRLLRDHVLHSRALQPGQRNRRLQPDGAILPPVPWWRSQRVERQLRHPDDLLVCRL